MLKVNFIETLQFLVQENPEHRTAWRKLAQFYFRKEQSEEAIEAFQKLIIFYPEATAYLLALAECLRQVGQSADAEKIYKQAVSINPKLHELWGDYGDALCEWKLFEKAVTAYQKSLSVKPDYLEALNSLGETFGKMEKYSKAEQAFRHALSYHPEDFWLNFNLAIALGSQQKFIEARQILLRLSKEFSEKHCIWEALGLIEVESNNIAAAEPFLKRAYTLAPEDTDVLLVMGYFHHKKGEYKKARSYFKKVLSIDKKYDDAQYMIAATYSKEGHKERAIAELQRLLRGKAKKRREQIMNDPDFTLLLKDSDFKAVLTSSWYN